MTSTFSARRLVVTAHAQPPVQQKEALTFENVHLAVRSYESCISGSWPLR